ncbi:MAG: peroxiredoxin [Candidatus Binataceae bacterium]
MLTAGDNAPDFALPSRDGSIVRLSDYRGSRLLIWFFVESDTPGCRDEGCGFRDHRAYFDDASIQVVGISFDSPAANSSFAAKYGFQFPLLSDLDRAVALAYGACNSLKAQQPVRMSFLIDANGVVERVYDHVDPRDHAARVLADILGV